MEKQTKEKPYVIFKEKKYVRGFGLMPYNKKNKKMVDERFYSNKSLKETIYG